MEAIMSENFSRDSAMAGGGRDRADASSAQTATDAFAKASDMARETAGKVKQAAADTASSFADQVKELLDQQVASGADMVGHFAHSAQRAADDLDPNAPQLAGLVRIFAERIETYADDLHGQTADQLWKSASDFTRRQPAIVFGLAALAGFFVFRTLKSSTAVRSPSLQPGQDADEPAASHFHGA
jgi:hypothetical protein